MNDTSRYRFSRWLARARAAEIPTSYLLGVRGGEVTKTYREEAAQSHLGYNSQPDEALAKLFRPKIVREYAPYLGRHSYNVFADRGTVKSREADGT